MTSALAPAIAAELAQTTRFQTQAADPTASVWVSANAGTGKTHVLTTRVLRLMLSGTPPERILCLTYTKAAAAEMSKRVFDRLARWATADTERLAEELEQLEGGPPSAQTIARARVLFAHAIDSPGGLKVQTIHAFCQALLQRFPFEAGVPPGFDTLDDAATRTLQREAIEDVLASAADPDSPLADALRTMVAHAAEDRFDDLLRQALGERAWLESVARLPGDDATGEPFAAAEALYRHHFAIPDGVCLADIEQDMAALMPRALVEHLIDVLSGGSANDQKQAARLRPVLAGADAATRIAGLRGFLMKSDGDPRSSFMTKKLKEAHPELEQRALDAQAQFIALDEALGGLRVVNHTMALIRLASVAMQRFTEAKRRRAALDFDDLIERTTSLLAAPAGGAEWVLYKLDGGLDHILVDESQDTSPRQWRIVEALAGEFFTDTGAGSATRTLFAVGDEKQSIYSFQGAAPHLFAEMGAHFARQVGATGRRWHHIPLALSFRTVSPVLDAVDLTFADPQVTPGVASSGSPVRHAARRAGQAGLVEIWPSELPEDAVTSEAWSPLDERPATSPVTRLAQRIAATIRGWIDSGERLASTGRPVRPGDVLILVRRRHPFAAPMVAALKAQGLPVAGADRIDLADQIAVQDLVSLGDFLTLPEDDLALAEVLKSPIFDLDDDDLTAFAPARKGTLWKALLGASPVNPRLAEAVELLRKWRREADFAPPYEFLAALLDHDGVRRRLISRLGQEAAEPIDELLSLAITYDAQNPPSLPGFLTWLRDAKREVKRDMEHGRDQVRVMTVHGAKGLEAPIVFLPDTCTTRSGNRPGGLVKLPGMDRPLDLATPFCWPVKGTSGLAPVSAAKASQAKDETEERNRLLYVAMTRARDRLYVCGFEARKKKRPPDSWYDLVVNGLDGKLTAVEDARGERVLRLASEQSVEIKSKTANDSTGPEAIPPPRDDPRALPEWALRPAPRESQLTMPLAPSRLAPYDTDDSGDPMSGPPPERGPGDEPPASPPRVLAAGNRFLRGTLTHALLEHLPGFPPESWAEAARAFVARRGLGLSTAARRSIVHETLAILKSPDLAILFGPDSRAEVAISALIPRPTGRGPALRLTGQIDRLAIAGNSVFIIDYKTNRPPPASAEEVADAYLYQLAAYRLALADMFPGKTLEASILWTDGPRRMPIPDSLLQRFEQKLWSIDPALIDADTT